MSCSGHRPSICNYLLDTCISCPHRANELFWIFRPCVIYWCFMLLMLRNLAFVVSPSNRQFAHPLWRMYLNTKDLLTPLAIFFSLSFGRSKLYIFDRRPINSKSGTKLHSFLNLPMTLAFFLSWIALVDSQRCQRGSDLSSRLNTRRLCEYCNANCLCRWKGVELFHRIFWQCGCNEILTCVVWRYLEWSSQ